MCRIEEHVYIKADGQRQKFEDLFPCYKSKHGKLCYDVKRKTTKYYPKSKSKPIIRDSRDGKYPAIPVKNYNRSSLSAASTNLSDFAIESPGSDASFTVRTGLADNPVLLTNPYQQPPSSYSTRPATPHNHHRHTSSASSSTTSSQNLPLHATSEPESLTDNHHRTPRFPPTIVHNPLQFIASQTQTSATPATLSSATFHINFPAPQDTTPRPYINFDNLLFPLDYSAEFHDRSAPFLHFSSGHAAAREFINRASESDRLRRLNNENEERRLLAQKTAQEQAQLRPEEEEKQVRLLAQQIAQEQAQTRAKEEEKQIRFNIDLYKDREIQRSEARFAESERRRTEERLEAWAQKPKEQDERESLTVKEEEKQMRFELGRYKDRENQRAEARLAKNEPGFHISSDEKSSVYDDTKTVITVKSSSTYHSAVSGTWSRRYIQSNRLRQDNEYSKLLQSKNLWPVDPMAEKDWSGRGQHAEFQRSEKRLLDKILPVQDDLGSTSTAIVQSVKCKRILLARKTIRCNRNFTKEKVIQEVAHLSKLEHSHVVQVIGTYVMGHDISILMYPVAGYNLETFMQDLDPESHTKHRWDIRIASLKTFIGCLTGAVEYIHSKMTKHMDIKPRNILVRDLRHIPLVPREETFKVYITDFGISRSYDTLDATETEGPTMFTRKYAAPEVVDRSKRGLSADIFSLGCVFVEIGTTLNSFPIGSTSAISRYQRAKEALNGDYDPLRGLEGVLYENEHGDTSYQANIDAVCEFIRKSWSPLGEGDISKTTEAQILAMLSEDPLNRPSIGSLAYSITPPRQCCTAGAELMEVAPSDLAEEEEEEEKE